MRRYFDYEQGSPEWLELRTGLMTASIAAAALTISPFKSRNRLMKDMKAEEAGHRRSLSSVPSIRWGLDNEATAAGLYAMEINPEQPVLPCGMWVVDEWIGASPDRTVGDEGLLEIKCPYGLKDDEEPVFLPIYEQPHYYCQVQVQLYCSGRKWCDFLQWTPHGYSLERVEASKVWADERIPQLAQFMAEYEEYADEPDDAPLDMSGDPAWMAAARDYAEIAPLYKEMKARFEAARDALTALSDGKCTGGGVTMKVAEVAGKVDYKKLVAAECPDADLNKYRGSPSLRKTLEVD